MSKILFFDIDGVLNDHQKLPSGVCGIAPGLRDNFNRIIDETGCLLVMHSAWRYLVTYQCPKQGRSSMTLDGMSYLLQTHGIKSFDAEANSHRLIGTTRPDVYSDGVIDRPAAIRELVYNSPEIDAFAIIDDLPLDWHGPEFFHCPNGLTADIATRIIEHLNQ